MSDMKALAQTVADELVGTAKSVITVLEKHDAEEAENDTEFCATLDSLVFCCETCDWWCDVGEMGAHWTCDECSEAEED